MRHKMFEVDGDNEDDSEMESELAVSFVQVEPFYKQILRAFYRRFRASWEEQRQQGEHKYGPPYVENKVLEEVFLDQVTKRRGTLKTIHKCLSSKMDPNVSNENDLNNRPLHYAAKHGNVALMKMLLRAGAKVDEANDLDQTPMIVASGGSHKNHTACVTILIKSGCDINFKDLEGSSALREAILTSNVQTVRTLLIHGVSLAWEESGGDETANALQFAKEVHEENAGVSDKSIEEPKAWDPMWWWNRLRQKRVCSSSSNIVDLLENHVREGHSRDTENGKYDNPIKKLLQCLKSMQVIPLKTRNSCKKSTADQGEGQSTMSQTPPTAGDTSSSVSKNSITNREQ